MLQVDVADLSRVGLHLLRLKWGSLDRADRGQQRIHRIIQRPTLVGTFDSEARILQAHRSVVRLHIGEESREVSQNTCCEGLESL